MGRPRTLGYEPRTLRALEAVETISRRVADGAKGFDEVSPTTSYEAMVLRHPTRFDGAVVRAAQRRLRQGDR